MMEQFALTPENLREVQLCCLDILRALDDFCQRHNLQYSLCGGCAIGALRHQGFIPWDDDIDVHMPRKDYEKLNELWAQDEVAKRYTLCRTGKGKFYDTMLTALVDERTTFIKEGQQDLDIPHGIRLEIIPLDGAPPGKWQRKIQLVYALVFYLFNRQFPPENRGGIARVLGKVALAVIRTPKAREKVWRFVERKMTKYPFGSTPYVTELCVTWKYMRQRYPYEVFASTRKAEFEGEEFNVPVQVERYLTQAFGDYMNLPPKEQRVPKHDAVLIDTKTSYKQYKGQHWCKE